MTSASSVAVFEPRRISNARLGMLLFLATEVMFFSGLISAYLIARAGISDWPPAGQPRLPVAATLINTLFLLRSGWTAWRFAKRSARKWLIATIALGAAFVGLQGREWVELVRFGLSSAAGLYGAFFYLIVGSHALHASCGLAALAWVAQAEDPERRFEAVSLYWYFVVGLWPILYGLVYLL